MGEGEVSWKERNREVWGCSGMMVYIKGYVISE